MHLSDLIPAPVASHADRATIGGIDISGLSSDSRQAEPGHLFVALKGSSGDGRAHAAAAVELVRLRRRAALSRRRRHQHTAHRVALVDLINPI